MIEISRTQDEEVGDGTTSVIILGNHFVVKLDNFMHAIVMEVISFCAYWQ